MARLGIGALIAAAVLGYMTYTEGTLAMQSSAQPETITLKQLIARGANGNAHIVLTDFELCDNLVNQFNENNKAVWTHVWIPVVPKDEVDPKHKGPLTPNNVKALLFSTSITNEPEMEAKLNQPRVQGMVTNRITSLDPKIRNLLKQSYPGTDFDKCLIIQEGRAPFGFGLVALTGGGAVLALLIGVVLLILSFRKS